MRSPTAGTTLNSRDPGPGKHSDMNESDTAKLAERTPVDGGGTSVHELARPADRRGERRWVALVAGLLSLVIGLSDVLAIFAPAWHEKLDRINHFVPGMLTDVTRTADVIVGLLLLMLSHGLRRRKRRAWQAVIALLAATITIHFIHSPRVPTTIVAGVLLVMLLVFRDQFYAIGDRRTRWLALWVFAGLVVADLAI